MFGLLRQDAARCGAMRQASANRRDWNQRRALLDLCWSIEFPALLPGAKMPGTCCGSRAPSLVLPGQSSVRTTQRQHSSRPDNELVRVSCETVSLWTRQAVQLLPEAQSLASRSEFQLSQLRLAYPECNALPVASASRFRGPRQSCLQQPMNCPRHCEQSCGTRFYFLRMFIDSCHFVSLVACSHFCFFGTSLQPFAI